MAYDKQIIGILLAVGERGISIGSLAKHVYNLNCTFFTQPDLKEIYNQVRLFLQRNSRSRKALVERTGRRGYYRLNPRNVSSAKQMVLDFDTSSNDDNNRQEEEKRPQDFSLSLFPEEETAQFPTEGIGQ